MNRKRLFAASYGHFSIDVLNSSIAMVLTAVAGVFELTISQIGLAAMIYTFAASLTQPLFGMLVDKVRGRWITGLGILWTVVFYGAAAFMPNYPALVTCLVIGALGSGAFHPAGMINATMAGGHYPTTATSIFFVLGQIGLALGPLVAGIVLQNYGLAGLPFMALAMSPAVVFALLFLHEPFADEQHSPKKTTGESSSNQSSTGQASPSQPSRKPAAANGMARRGLYVALAFVLLITLRSATQQTFTTLLPKYFDDLGIPLSVNGAMLFVLGLAGASGTFIGGYLGDRYNRRMVIFYSMTLGAIFSLLMLYAGGWAYVLAALAAGIMMNVPHSILLIMAQRLLPARKGMIGGAVLGLMFASGAAMAGLASWVADFVGLPLVLSVIALLPIGAGLCALTLPSTRGVEPAPAPLETSEEPAAAD